MVKITSVEPRSYASRAGIREGDCLVSINENEINDVLDYRFYLADRCITILLDREGEHLAVKIKKGEYDDIGLGFETPLMDKKHTCKNGCIFCFIDQNPEGMRESIYFKDDDSRLSFIHGNYITLTNLTDKDVERIVKMRFSPINISIHTTNPELRVKMMKNKRSGEVLRYLDDFKNAGLRMCGQIVLCKGVNDGEELIRSLYDLAEYYPAMSSVAIVPAGLTKHRDKLYPLTDFTPEEAAAVIDAVDEIANKHKAEHGERLFFVSDEFYLKSGREIPDADYYEDYPQIENGVGMIRSLLDETGLELSDIVKYGENGPTSRRVSIATGVGAYPTLSAIARKLEALYDGLKINVYEIKNRFFGETITVSGLLTGRDIRDQLADKELFDELLIPANALRYGEDVFLCDMTLGELSQSLGVTCTPVGADGYELIHAILGDNE